MYIHTVSSNWKSPTLLTTRKCILVFVLQSLWLFHSTHGENGLKTQWNRKDCWRGECSENASLCPFFCFPFSPSWLNLSSTIKPVIVLNSAPTRTLVAPFPCPNVPALLELPQPFLTALPPPRSAEISPRLFYQVCHGTRKNYMKYDKQSKFFSFWTFRSLKVETNGLTVSSSGEIDRISALTVGFRWKCFLLLIFLLQKMLENGLKHLGRELQWKKNRKDEVE